MESSVHGRLEKPQATRRGFSTFPSLSNRISEDSPKSSTPSHQALNDISTKKKGDERRDAMRGEERDLQSIPKKFFSAPGTPTSFQTPSKSKLSELEARSAETISSLTPKKFSFEVPLPFQPPFTVEKTKAIEEKNSPVSKQKNPDEKNEDAEKEKLSKKRSADSAIIGGPDQIKKKRRTEAPEVPSDYTLKMLEKQLGSKANLDDTTKTLLKDRMDEFWCNLGEDLGAFSRHARRSTIRNEDVELFLRRTKIVSSQAEMEDLARQHLPAEMLDEYLPDLSARFATSPGSNKKK